MWLHFFSEIITYSEICQVPIWILALTFSEVRLYGFRIRSPCSPALTSSWISLPTSLISSRDLIWLPLKKSKLFTYGQGPLMFCQSYELLLSLLFVEVVLDFANLCSKFLLYVEIIYSSLNQDTWEWKGTLKIIKMIQFLKCVLIN